jgi:gliding motility-associated-like protein
VTLSNPVVDDNCTVANVSNDAPETFPIGNTTVTWTVTDASGNTATCEQIVTVSDNELPTIECPAPVAVYTDADECTASNVTLGNPVVDDNCTVADVSNDAPVTFPIGNTTVTWTVTDASGNTATCEQIVTVSDNELPTIECPAPVAAFTDRDECTASGISLGTPIVDDNCSIESVTNDAPADFPIGNTTVTWTVTDASGNTATCEQIVTVEDAQLPTIACPAQVNVTADANECTASNVVLGNPVVDDNCTVANVSNDAPETFPIGNTTVTWTVTDASGNTATCEQIVTVSDNELPTIECPAPVAVNTDADECTASNVTLGNPVVDDNCTVASVSNDAPETFPIGNTTVTWTVTDASGNTATCEQVITVTDNQLPTIICPEDVVSCSKIVELTEPEVYDNCGIEEVTNDAPASYPPGTTSVTWTITDVNGNVSTCEQLVHVSLLQASAETTSQLSCHDASDAVISVLVEGATGSLTYSLNEAEPQSSGTFSGLSAGTYIVMVEDENGCTALTDEIIISNPSPIEAELTVSSQVSCYNASNGSIEVTATGGTGQLSYSLNGNPAQTSGTFTNLEAGSYTVLVEDENQCSVMLSDIVIDAPEALSVNANVLDSVSCSGESSAALEVSVTGGTEAYSVFLTNETNGMEYSAIGSHTFENLSAGSYAINVIDSKGCSETTHVEIGTPDPLTLHYGAYCEAGIVGIELTAGGGTGSYRYSIDGGENWSQSNQFDDLVNNTSIAVAATDENNCMSDITIIPVESLNTLNASADVVSENSCYGVSDASIIVNTEGGVAPYTYTVNGDHTYNSGTIDSLSAGYYTIHVRDSNECPAVTEVSIESRDEIIVDVVSTTNADCMNHKNGSAEIEAYGGSGSFDYTWENGETTGMATNLSAGTHRVTVNDMNGCEVIEKVVIESDITGEELTVNNVFTPNRDGINDFFVISNLELYPDNELIVYNRWGNEVYSKTSYDNLWDGSNLSEGTYFYVLSVNMCGKEETLNGYITILD